MDRETFLIVVSIGVLIAALVGLLAWFVYENFLRKSAREEIEEFTQRFPGTCPVCAYDRYLRFMGERVPRAASHYCPEQVARTGGW